MPATKVELIISAKDKASRVLKGIGGSAKTMFGVFQKGATVAAGAITGIAAAITGLAIQAGKFQSVSDAYAGMTKGMGISGKQLVADVKKASSGTIAEIDIMRGFLKASTLIGEEALGEGGKNFQRFAIIAKKAARATGQDVDFLFDSIINGVGRMSVKWLDNTGIVLNNTQVLEDYAKSLGKSADELTDVEKKVAITNAFLEKGERLYKDVAVSAGGISSSFARFKIAISETATEIGLFFIPIVQPLIEFFGNLISKVKPLIQLFKTGDFTKEIGESLGVFEDSPIVSIVLRIRGAIQKLIDAFVDIPDKAGKKISEFGPIVTNVLLKLVEKFEEFVDFLVANKDTIVNFARDAFGFIVEKGTELFNFIKDNKESILEFAKTFVVLAAAIAGIGAVVGIITALTTPLGLIVLAITGISLAIVTLRNLWDENWMGIQDRVLPIVDWFQNTVFPAISEIAAVVRDILADAFSSLGETFNQVMPEIKAAWEEFKAAIGDSQSLIDILKVIGAIVGATLVVAFQFLIGVVKTFMSIIASVIGILTGLFTILSGVADFIVGVFTLNFEKMGTGLEKIFNGLAKVIKSVFVGALNIVIQAINTIIRTANTLTQILGEKLGLEGAATFEVGEIPTLQHGTDFFGGGTALVGEQGPELVNLPRGAQVLPADQTRGAMDGGVNINVKVPLFAGSESEKRAIAEEIWQSIVDLARARGKTPNEMLNLT